MSPKDSDELLDEEYLLEEEQKDDLFAFSSASKRNGLWARLLPYSAALNVILLLSVVVAVWIVPIQRSRGTCIPNEVYSPAASAVEYKTVVFTGGLHGDKSDYQGSSDEVNARWEALYNDVGISQISAQSAAHLPNATTPLASDPTQFMVELDVFHQLHCLNLMRKLAYPTVFPMDLTSGSDEAEDNIYHMEQPAGISKRFGTGLCSISYSRVLTGSKR